jgi:hypothetical protein
MKTWTLPVAGAQKFAANEYVAACYQIYCGGPNNNASCEDLFADENGNGIYDQGERSIANPPYVGATFHGCGGYHRVVGEGVPVENGFVLQDGKYIPVFYWIGEALNPTLNDGDMADFHFADLTRGDAVIFSENPNHS